jgi:hypothetical protein
MDVSEFMQVGSVEYSKDTIEWWDDETHEPIFGDHGESLNIAELADSCGGDEESALAMLQDILIRDPEENGEGIEITDVMPTGETPYFRHPHFLIEVNRETLEDALAERYEEEKNE